MNVEAGDIIRSGKGANQSNYYVISVNEAGGALVVELDSFRSVDTYSLGKLIQDGFTLVGHVAPLGALVELDDKSGQMKLKVKKALFPYLSERLKERKLRLTVVSELTPLLVENYLFGGPHGNEKLVVGVQASDEDEVQLVELGLVEKSTTLGVKYYYRVMMVGYDQDDTPLLATLILEFLAVTVGYTAILEVDDLPM